MPLVFFFFGSENEIRVLIGFLETVLYLGV